LLAKLADRERQNGHLTVVICADALDVHRLSEELPYFEPVLTVAAHFRTGKHFPTTSCLRPRPGLGADRNAVSPDDRQPAADTTGHRRAAGGRRHGQRSASRPPSFVAARTFWLRQGQRIDVEQLRSQLALAGYHAVSQVVGPGEFSLRGGLIDFFPTGATLPLRLDLLDDVVETIAAFDPDSQRRRLPGARGSPSAGARVSVRGAGAHRFRGRWRDAFEGDPSRAPL